MKKVISFFAVFFAAIFICAADAPAASGAPTELIGKKHTWYRLAKSGKMRRLPDGSILFTLATPESPWGDIGYSRKITVNPGEKLKITMKAKGVGRLEYGIRLNKSGNILTSARLAEEVKEYTAVFDFDKFQKDLPQEGMLKVILQGGAEGVKAEISSFTYTLTK